ncbi:Asp-tRNA(Asn)/Glu-tRNA(Gln) amidotransferase subunit GatA [Prochlorococcus marinus]|uniref:Glutamyl-tRNA(Gln) amidotransferase subunit A n=1 Tax=Prochlorococcus marinus XMU1408 TaxID=2213228 RepID=A0A318R4C6_PROMR|nr:Asp-tRNA(Asn)/Glu-tRNA(Gln) amidotransferase subunit GatA [Prochlorococcus marinus]MBW3041893.1 Asp-tRNA(Asn)/Glu-tRNA(Gln) amidotransferase GatCAB subunit A [Prochlorococcus marinus str. XMU1408]PYE03024.1 Asp-tRNA(Asn)/Glu-tRNA(Gln) amidotransferase GatCAB subunit A [Prochlorococcus marinus XMU1408]
MTFADLRQKLKSGEVSSKELVQEKILRIKQLDPKLNSFLSVNSEQALKQAEFIDNQRSAGEILPPLSGIPLAIKDNLCTKGIKTTCASKILEDFVPPYESTVTKRLLKSGAVMIGKTNMDEFAMGSSTETSAFGPTLNPWDISKVPGGSSGGSAASVAAGLCFGSLGSDTGGSIRQPASFCGVVGMKPTYGRVSRWGLIAFASSLDQVGPFANNVSDAAEILQVISGKDDFDSTTVDVPVPNYLDSLSKSIKGLKIGLIDNCFQHDGLAKDVKESVLSAASLLEKQGAEIINLSCPRFNDGIATYYVIAPSEASANLARYDGVKYGFRSDDPKSLIEMTSKSRAIGFGSEVKRRILIGTYALSAGYVDAYYKKAQQVRTLIRKDFDNAFKKVDILLAPTSPTTAFGSGENVDNPMAMYLSDLLTIPANLAGLPAISLPCGFDKTGLPIGLQLIGNVFDEAKLLQVASQYEIAADVFKNKPKSDFTF